MLSKQSLTKQVSLCLCVTILPAVALAQEEAIGLEMLEQQLLQQQGVGGNALDHPAPAPPEQVKDGGAEREEPITPADAPQPLSYAELPMNARELALFARLHLENASEQEIANALRALRKEVAQ